MTVSSNSTIDVSGAASGTVSALLTIGANTLSVSGGSTGADTAYNLTLGSVGGVALIGTATFNVASNGNGAGSATLGAIAASANGINKSGAGTLILSGVNNYTGPTNQSERIS